MINYHDYYDYYDYYCDDCDDDNDCGDLDPDPALHHEVCPRKLNTSINHLLLWLCASSLLEATLGILAKCLILGKRHHHHHQHHDYHRLDCRYHHNHHPFPIRRNHLERDHQASDHRGLPLSSYCPIFLRLHQPGHTFGCVSSAIQSSATPYFVSFATSFLYLLPPHICIICHTIFVSFATPF